MGSGSGRVADLVVEVSESEERRHGQRDCRDAVTERGIHGRGPPHRPPGGAALWGRVQLIENQVEHAIGVLMLVLVQPGSNDAGDITIGGAHRATSGAVRASASSAARSPRIA